MVNLKSITFRFLYNNTEKKNKIYNYVNKSSLIFMNLYAKKSFISKSRIVNFCTFTGRSRRVYRKLKISGIFINKIKVYWPIQGLHIASW